MDQSSLKQKQQREWHQTWIWHLLGYRVVEHCNIWSWCCGARGYTAAAWDAGMGAALFPVQLPVNAPRKTAKIDQIPWDPTPNGRCGWSSCLQLGPALVVKVTWGVNQQMLLISLFLSLDLLLSFSNKYLRHKQLSWVIYPVLWMPGMYMPGGQLRKSSKYCNLMKIQIILCSLSWGALCF